jgi:two-component system, response regulator PdtaR
MGSILPFPRDSAASAPRVVLVVEDEVIVRMTAADELRARGFDVIEAYNADEAITLLKTQTPIALLFTDVQLPGSVDGLALARLVRETHPDMKIIITTGNSAVPDDGHGADAFFRKPYLLERVVASIESLLADCP